MFESKKAGEMWAVVVAASVLAMGAAYAQSLGACRLAACGSLGTVAQVPVQFVSAPDMAVQFSTCLDSSSAGAFVTGLRDKLASEMRDLDVNHDDLPPAPEVRHACVGGKSTFGGWLVQPYGYGGTDSPSARNVGLGTVDVLAGAETFAFNFRPIGLERLVQIRWQDQPRRVNDDGDADPDGDVHLSDFDLYFNPNSVTGDPATGQILQGPSVDLAINGSYDGLFSTTAFTLDVVDFPAPTPYGNLHCETVSGAHATETTVDTVLASLTGGAGGSLGDVVGEGPACKIANGLALSRTILVPQTHVKVVFSYSRVTSAADSGLTFGGTWSVVPRAPYVTVQGPSLLKAEDGSAFTGTYSVQTTDLRPPFTVSWTSRDASPVSGTNRTSASLSWNLPGLAIGQKTNRNVSVTLTDADNTTVSGLKPVVLSRVLSTDPGLNPPCDKKPWLPQCKTQ